jgi:DNA-binding transcriptional MerR regulator
MRISELSRESGIPLPTIKYYLREGLLPAGEPTARNQASYHQGHLARLRLIRALSSVGKLDLATIGGLLATAEDESTPMPALHEAVSESVCRSGPCPADADAEVGAGVVHELLAEFGWTVTPSSPSLRMLARTVSMMRQLGCDADVSFLRPYGAEAARAAAAEAALPAPGSVISERMAAVARSILLDAAVLALRRMAQESRTSTRSLDGAAVHAVGVSEA